MAEQLIQSRLCPLKALFVLGSFCVIFIFTFNIQHPYILIESEEELLSINSEQIEEDETEGVVVRTTRKDDDKKDKDSAKASNAEGEVIFDLNTYRKIREEKFHAWFEGNQTDKLLPGADADGPILDFAISGFAKCGTTSMEANLGYIAPMPVSDICAPVAQTVYYAYKNWPQTYDNSTNPTKILRGTKCPRNIFTLEEYSTYLPKTLIIVGIRHPILFFQSFWNMLADFHNRNVRNRSPYDYINNCKGVPLCLQKTRFHLPLASIGKTLLSKKERELLAPSDNDGGMSLSNRNINNPVFLYELSEISEDYLWEELAKLLKVPSIQHDVQKGSNRARKAGRNRLNICDAKYDEFRSLIMPHAYNMSVWFCEYLVPTAKNKSNNIYMADPDRFCEIVKSYVNDPCDRLIRQGDGNYTLKGDLVES